MFKFYKKEEHLEISGCAVQVDAEGLEWNCQQWRALVALVDTNHNNTGVTINLELPQIYWF